MPVATEVHQAWITLLGYLRQAPNNRWFADFPMRAVRVIDAFMHQSLRDQAGWRPVPMNMPLNARGELYCEAHALNPNKVWLVVASPEGKARLLLPDNVRLFYTVELPEEGHG